MTIGRVRITSKFKSAFRKLPREIQARAREKEVLFRKNSFDPRLDTHKLHGKYKDYWAFTVIGRYRVMFVFVSENSADFINIGTHEIYK